MTDQMISEDELHAYVDGELPAERRGAVEAWLAAHADDAARVAAWRAQAELIRKRYGGVASELPPKRLQVERLTRSRRGWMAAAIAAVFVAFIAGGAAGWFARGAEEMCIRDRPASAGSTHRRNRTADGGRARTNRAIRRQCPCSATGPGRSVWSRNGPANAARR